MGQCCSNQIPALNLQSAQTPDHLSVEESLHQFLSAITPRVYETQEQFQLINPLIIATLDKLKKLIIKDTPHFKMEALLSIMGNRKGCYRLKNGTIYQGDWLEDARHGFGKTLNIDGSYYEGFYKNDQYYGFGRLIFHDGDYYEGEFENNLFNGYGVLLSTFSYEGEWLNGEKHGQGKELWSNGITYKGEYKYGQKDGQGKLMFNDGSYYEGEFQRDTFNNIGTFYWSDGRKYTGEWRDGVKEGQGQLKWPTGQEYKGEFIADEFEGQGEMNYPDGKIFVGYWKSSKQNGDVRKEYGIWGHQLRKLKNEKKLNLLYYILFQCKKSQNQYHHQKPRKILNLLCTSHIVVDEDTNHNIIQQHPILSHYIPRLRQVVKHQIKLLVKWKSLQQEKMENLKRFIPNQMEMALSIKILALNPYKN